MSIYATGWELKIPTGRKVINGEFVETWATVYAQCVPDHIGQPSEGYDEDPYADFLPPIVPNYDPMTTDTNRAIVVVQEGREEKDGQRYVDPVLVMAYDEYLKMPFEEFLTKIHQGVK